MTRRMVREVYLVEFDRVGQHQNVPNLTVPIQAELDDLEMAAELASAIWRRVRRYLLSHVVEVAVADNGTGTITVSQGRPAGSFRWSRVAQNPEEVARAPRAA